MIKEDLRLKAQLSSCTKMNIKSTFKWIFSQDSLVEVEEKYRKAMVSNAQLDNEKTNLIYQVDTLRESLMEMEEILCETRRECEDKNRVRHTLPLILDIYTLQLLHVDVFIFSVRRMSENFMLTVC